LAERDEDLLDRKRDETLAAIGPEPLAALDRAETASEAAKAAAEEAVSKVAGAQSSDAEKTAAADTKQVTEQAATAETAKAQLQADAAAAALAEPAKQDLELLDQYLEQRRQDIEQVAGKLAAAA
jgi:predicted metal-dependent phosphoesterase TrpH